MDQENYRAWWLLHLRVARGETLSAEDREFYEAGRRVLERQETLARPLAELREALAASAVLQSEHALLEARRQQLEAEIAMLEAALRQGEQEDV